MIGWLAVVAALAGDDPALDAVEAAALRWVEVAAACEAAPRSCPREDLADAAYGRALWIWLREFLVDGEAVAVLRHVDPGRFELLPEPVRAAVGDVPAWVAPAMKPPLSGEQAAGTAIRIQFSIYELSSREARKASREDPRLTSPGVVRVGRGVVPLPGTLVLQPTMQAMAGQRFTFLAQSEEGPFYLSGRTEREDGRWSLELDSLAGLTHTDLRYDGDDAIVVFRTDDQDRVWLVEGVLSEVEVDAAWAGSVAAWSDPPVVVGAWPEPGAVGVPPGPTELRLEFDRAMSTELKLGTMAHRRTGETWPWAYFVGDGVPLRTAPAWSDDATRLTLPVDLEPNQVYRLWINLPNPYGSSIKGQDGVPAERFLLQFETGAAVTP